MQENCLNVYLSGEIHTNWRENISREVTNLKLPVILLSPVTNHSLSDDCGVEILGQENSKFWHDYKGAGINSIRTKNLIEKSDIVVVKFGEKYKQWNAAFEAGIAISLGKSLITLHEEGLDHALKEVDAASKAVCRSEEQVIETLRYVTNGEIKKSKL